MVRRHKKGFTLVEVMIVVAIIGLLAAIAIPNFVRARETAEKSACISNLKQIQGAVEMWVLDTSAASSSTASGTSDLVNYIKVWPKCKASTYAIPAADGTPVCPNSIGGHNL